MLQRLAKLVVFASIALAPTAAYAQASITGVVRDTSNAVLPGVTVEATSPALIEKVRVVVTDGTGQYRIVDLRPGLYTVTFTLPGFASVRREGIELAGAFTATVNAELRVGSLEETITVTGETPTVDVQSTLRQRVMDREIIDTIPTGRDQFNLGVLIPGVSVSGGQDVGGSGGQSAFPNLEVHGAGDPVHSLGGMRVTNMSTTGTHQPIRINPAATQELTLDISGGDAEYAAGGVRTNRVPREGGNTFNGTFFTSFANSAMQASNLTQDLRDRGLSIPDSIDYNFEINPGFGGPIKRDRLWFYVAALYRDPRMFAAGLFHDLNVNNPNAWTYEPDLSRPVSMKRTQKDGVLTLTWQATPRNKFSSTWQEATVCFCPQAADLTVSLEAAEERSYPLRRMAVAAWTTPITNRLLVEGRTAFAISVSDDYPRPWLSREMIGVEEQSTGMSYRAGDSYRHRLDSMRAFGGVVSYITGSHAFKAGAEHRSGYERFRTFDYSPLSFRLNNGVPNQLTQRAYPIRSRTNVDHEVGLFAQDRWTIRRLTLNYGVRYDYFAVGFPEQHIGPAPLAPTRDLTFPAQDAVSYHDVTPRLGAAYDVFGTGRTALKVTLNRYLASLGAGSGTGAINPVNNLVVNTTRSWNDANGDFVPHCDLVNALANGECGPLANAAFGQVADVAPGAVVGRRGVVSVYDPDLLRGWGRREYNWEFSVGVQQELLPRVAAEVGYFRRWWGNFDATENRATTAADYDPFSITAPVDPRLPGGGGYVISGLYDINPTKFGQVDNFVTRASNYGKQIEYWHGVDVTASARLPGLLLQGGTSTGRRVEDDCEIRPRLDNPSLLYCHAAEAFLTQVKFLGSYTIPRVDVQFSGTFQSIPGPEIAANHRASNAVVARSLGRNLAGGARNVTVNLVEPGTLYGERLNQLDLRIAKILRFGRTRTSLNLDIFNALNSSTVLRQNNTFGPVWQQPNQILLARFFKLSAQFDF